MSAGILHFNIIQRILINFCDRWYLNTKIYPFLDRESTAALFHVITSLLCLNKIFNFVISDISIEFRLILGCLLKIDVAFIFPSMWLKGLKFFPHKHSRMFLAKLRTIHWWKIYCLLLLRQSNPIAYMSVHLLF